MLILYNLVEKFKLFESCLLLKIELRSKRSKILLRNFLCIIDDDSNYCCCGMYKCLVCGWGSGGWGVGMFFLWRV